MIKYYCDICNKEIDDINNQRAEYGNFQKREIKSKILQKGGTEQGLEIKSYLTCKNCSKKIEKFIEKESKQDDK